MPMPCSSFPSLLETEDTLEVMGPGGLSRSPTDSDLRLLSPRGLSKLECRQPNRQTAHLGPGATVFPIGDIYL